MSNKNESSHEIEAAIDEIPPKTLRLVLVASSLGTGFEWYDFFLVGLLASVMAEHFFAGLSPAMGFIFGLLTFAIGLAFRPLGAMFFGSIGDKMGRKYAFLVTVTLMGLSTFMVGLLPDYKAIGIWAPILLVSLRIIQGFALGGEYGGAVIYVAEHSKAKHRGRNTSLIQTSAAFGLFTSLIVVYLCRTYLDQIFGPDSFKTWGWRVPFLVSIILLAIAIMVRVQLNESPGFAKLKSEGKESKTPLKEVFSDWAHIKLVLLALFGFMIAQGVTWYTSHFYAPVFLEKQMMVDPKIINMWLLVVVTVSSLLYVFFGWLSDHIGRKPIMIFGMLVAVLGFYPAFQGLLHFANPALEQALKNAPVTVIAKQEQCSLQFNPVGKTPDGRDAFATSCDVAKSFLANAGVAYKNQSENAGDIAQVKIGNVLIDSVDITQLDANGQKAAKKEFSDKVKAELVNAGYPAKADPAQINHLGVIAILIGLIIGATALYGPMAATLVELFPTRIRYTALSVPYHVGTGVFGGFVPATSFAFVASTGNMYAGLWYPIIATAICVVVTILFLPETLKNDIHK